MIGDVVEVRSPVPADAPAVLEVMSARDLADLGVIDYTLEDLREEWSLTEVDLASDAVVVEDHDGQIVGYAIVRRPGALVMVAPAHEGRGIGTRLLEWTERREREKGRTHHRQWVGTKNERARSLLLGAGYTVARGNFRMALRLEDALGRPADPPAGIRLRALDVDRDVLAIHTIDEASFAGQSDYQPETLAAFTEEHLQAHDFDPGLSRVAERGGSLVGFLLARRWRDEAVGFVDILAVHPDQQRQGLGQAMLLSALAGFAAGGLREAQLGVSSDNARALRLYERVGMTPRFRVDMLERPVSS
jgi:mycothiol synthase